MGKASRRRTSSRETAGNSRQERRTAAAAQMPFVVRPFEGLNGETDWVAMREIVPAATATVRLRPGIGPGAPDAADAQLETVTVTTVLPLSWPGVRRANGEALLGLQSVGGSGDASRDLAAVLLEVVAAEPGNAVAGTPPVSAETPRLQDLLDTSAPFDVTVHDGFDFWVPEGETLDEEAQASLARADATVVPTVKLEGAASAYWCRIGTRTHLRWVLPDQEDAATDAIARLHAAGTGSLGPTSRLLGAFRASGLLVPVWDLDPDAEAAAYEQPLQELALRYAEALVNDAALCSDERHARAGLLTRQITLR